MESGKCNQAECKEIGTFRFTWPGQDEAKICGIHVGKLLDIAAVMGMHLQVIPVGEPEEPATAAVERC